jgi:hypothetical protein
MRTTQSPLTGAIYYPAVNQIAADLHVSVSKVALTVTTYLVSGLEHNQDLHFS